MTKFFAWAGGRKVGLGLIGLVVLTIMAFPLRADFMDYALAVLLALGLTQGSVAYEDVKRRE